MLAQHRVSVIRFVRRSGKVQNVGHVGKVSKGPDSQKN